MQAPDQTSPSYDFDRADVNAIAADIRAKSQARAEQDRKNVARIREILGNSKKARNGDAFVRSNWPVDQ